MSKTTKKAQTNTARPAAWVDELLTDYYAATTIRAGMTIFHLYPTSARPSNRREAAALKAELIEAIDKLHYADLVALRDAMRILAADHAGARRACADTRKYGHQYIAREMGKGRGRR